MAQYGYIGNNPDTSPVVIARQNFSLTGVQTNFTFSSGYSVGYIDAYLNGVKLIEGDDFTATDGSIVGLTTFAQSGDIVEFVAYKAFDIGNVTNALGNFTVGNKLTVSGVTSATSAVYTGVVTATGGFNIGISSAGTVITSGPVKTLNFVGTGNTFAVNGTTVDISIVGGAGGGSFNELDSMLFS